MKYIKLIFAIGITALLLSCNTEEDQLVTIDEGSKDYIIGQLELRSGSKKLVRVSFEDGYGTETTYLEYDNQDRVNKIFDATYSYQYDIAYFNDRIEVKSFEDGINYNRTEFNLVGNQILSYDEYYIQNGTSRHEVSANLTYNQNELTNIKMVDLVHDETYNLDFELLSDASYTMTVVPFEDFNIRDVVLDTSVPEVALFGSGLIFGETFERESGLWLGVFLQSSGYLPNFVPLSYENRYNDMVRETVNFNNTFSNDQLTTMRSDGSTYIYHFE